MKPILIHEVHDMWPSTLVELGGISKHHPFVQMLQLAENSAYKHSDVVASILPNVEEYMLQHGLKKGTFHYIPNGIVLGDWEKPEKLPSVVEESLIELKKNGHFLVGYFGGHALSNALDILLDAAKLLRDIDIQEKIIIVMVGDGVEKERLLDRIASESIKNVVTFESVPKKSVPNLLAHFDCIYIGTLDSPLYRFGLGMNKFYDAMFSGKPIILSTNAKNTAIEEAGCGIIIPTNNPKVIADTMHHVSCLAEEERDALGNKGKEAVLSKYTYDILADSFEKIMGKNKKNILLINHYAGSVDMGMEFRPYYLAREWVKKGHRVDIIAADFSHLRRRNPAIKKDFSEELIDGIHYHWVHTGKYSGNGIKRAITMLEFVGKIIMNSKKIVLRLDPSVIITSSTYPLDTFAGQCIRKSAEKL